MRGMCSTLQEDSWCGDSLEPDLRNAKRQKCWGKPACRAAPKAARQRRWLDQPQNRDYFYQ